MNGDTEASIAAPTFTLDPADAVNAAEYELGLSGGSASNYSLTLQAGKLTITQAPLTVIANAVERIYGQSNPPFDFSYAGFLNGDNESALSARPDAICAATEITAVGKYAIELSGGASQNYILTLQNGELTIKPAPLHVLAYSNFVEYGSPDPIAFSFEYGGFVNGDDPGDITPPSTETDAGPASDVGEYEVRLNGEAGGNYEFVFVESTVLIVPVTLAVQAMNRQDYTDRRIRHSFPCMMDSAMMTMKPILYHR